MKPALKPDVRPDARRHVRPDDGGPLPLQSQIARLRSRTDRPQQAAREPHANQE